MELEPIGVFRSRASRKYDAPRQGALGGGEGVVRLEPGRNFETALRDLDGFERLWIVFVFDRNGGAWRPTVRPPVAAPGRRRVGLFASRSPYRPCPVGLTCARIVGVGKLEVEVAETDILDGSPVLDIKPYVPSADAFPDARAGWVDDQRPDRRSVVETPLFREQAAFVLSLGGPDLAATARVQLALDPLDSTRKRVAPRDSASGDPEWTLSLRMFRVDFSLAPDSGVLALLRVRSGYSAAELADPADPYADKALHRRFVQESFRPTAGE